MPQFSEVDNSRSTESPLKQIASDAYLPESRIAFANNFSTKSCHNESMSDDTLNKFFKSNMDTSQLYGLSGKPGETSVSDSANHNAKQAFKSFDEGTDRYESTSRHLGDALKALNSENPGRALQELKLSKFCLGVGTEDIKNGLKQHEGKRDENSIVRGVDKAEKNGFAIDAVMDLIKGGCTDAAKQVLQDAIKRMDMATSQVESGVDNLRHGAEPPIKPGNFLVVTFDGLRLPGGSGSSGMLSGELMGKLSDPLGLFRRDDSSRNSRSSGFPMPHDLLSSVAPPNPSELLRNPLELANRPLELASKPLELASKPLELATKPFELASKPLELATKPLEPLKNLFKKLF